MPALRQKPPPPSLFFDHTFLWKRKVGTVLFFEKKSRQKKLQLSGTIYRFLIIYTDVACKKAKETLVIGKFVRSFMPPLCKGRGTTKWWKGCKKQSLTAFGGAEPLSATLASMLRILANPFTQRSRKRATILISSRRRRTVSLRSSIFVFISA